MAKAVEDHGRGTLPIARDGCVVGAGGASFVRPHSVDRSDLACGSTGPRPKQMVLGERMSLTAMDGV
jgi:hypothetical protein